MSTQELEWGKSLPRALQPPEVQISAVKDACIVKGMVLPSTPGGSLYKHRCWRFYPFQSTTWDLCFQTSGKLLSLGKLLSSGRAHLAKASLSTQNPLESNLQRVNMFPDNHLAWFSGLCKVSLDQQQSGSEKWFFNSGFQDNSGSRSEPFHTGVVTFPPSRLLQCKEDARYPSKKAFSGGFQKYSSYLTFALL